MKNKRNIHKGVFKAFIIIVFLGILIIFDILVGLKFNEQEQRGGIIISKNDFVLFETSDEGVVLELSPLMIYSNHPSSPESEVSFYKINSWGIRGDEVEEKKNKGIVRILLLGGSSAFGYGVLNDKDCISEILEMKSERFEVINAGTLGYTSAQELSAFLYKFNRLNPDIVVSYNLWNDLIASFVTGNDYSGVCQYYNDFEDYLVEKRNEEKKPCLMFKSFLHSLFLKTNIYKQIYSRNKKKKIIETYGKIDKRFQNKETERFRNNALEHYKRNIRHINTISGSYQFKYLVVLQPEIISKEHKTKEELEIIERDKLLWQKYHENFGNIYNKSSEELEKYFENNNIKYLNINKSDRFVNCKETLFLDEIHTNKKGNEIIADEIFNKLKKLNYIQINDQK